MYTPRQILTGLKWTAESPSLLFREVNRIYFSKRFGTDYYRPGTDFLSEDWDTLVVLDACRYDMFDEQCDLPGELQRRTSRGSHTVQFLHGNFAGRTLLDTVYTTASPQLERRREEIDPTFHHVHNVWDTDRWDESEGTVRPESMTGAALESHCRFPNKRHVVHYMQPHYPFIGFDVDEQTRGFDEDAGFDIWNSLMRGQIDVDAADIWDAYRTNLDLALEAVSDLLDAVEGRVVVTADHGNMVGEHASPIPIREWGHPWRVYTDELIEVPWLVREGQTRRRTTAEQPVSDETKANTGVMEERLQDLGYV